MDFATVCAMLGKTKRQETGAALNDQPAVPDADRQ
jgi:hypothetical protein